MKENPLKKVLREKGMNRDELAVIAGIDSMNIYQLLNGVRAHLPKSVLSALEKIGYDPEEIQKEYEAWRKEKAQKLLEKIGG